MLNPKHIVSAFLILLISINFSIAQTSQMYEGEKINEVDINNRKQGHWIFFGKMKKLAEYSADAKVEEGGFVNSRKQGLWKKYFANQNTMSEITYVNSRPNGPYKVYYDNGQIQEQGVWKNNRNTQTFTRWHENGEKQQEFNFTASGKREGKQVYYHENGKVMIEGNWAGGKEDGVITEYYDNGKVKSQKTFLEGGIDPGKTKTFEENKPAEKVEKVEPIKEEDKAPEVSEEELKNVTLIGEGKKPVIRKATSVPDGQNTLYNGNKQLSQKGEFKNGKLYTGHRYNYDENGILESIFVYKRGRKTGEAPLPND